MKSLFWNIFSYHHPEYKANPDTIPWNIDDGMIDFLPGMVTDITLKSAGKVLIIDAKYYGHTMRHSMMLTAFIREICIRYLRM